MHRDWRKPWRFTGTSKPDQSWFFKNGLSACEVRPSDDSLIVVPCKIGLDPLALALDTGASHTTIDLTPLLVAGYEMKDAIRNTQIETASGVIDTQVFVIKEFSSLGVTKYNFEVCAYDFQAASPRMSEVR